MTCEFSLARNKFRMASRLACLHLIVIYSKGQGQSQQIYTVNISEKMTDDKHYYCHQLQSCLWSFDWHICI